MLGLECAITIQELPHFFPLTCSFGIWFSHIFRFCEEDLVFHLSPEKLVQTLWLVHSSCCRACMPLHSAQHSSRGCHSLTDCQTQSSPDIVNDALQLLTCSKGLRTQQGKSHDPHAAHGPFVPLCVWRDHSAGPPRAWHLLSVSA